MRQSANYSYLILALLNIVFLFSCKDEEIDNESTDLTFAGRNWELLNANVFEAEIGNDDLVLSLKSNAAWFNGEQGGFFFTTVVGDFDFSATVVAGQIDDLSAPVLENYSFGGLMVRNPANTSQNYVHVVTGTGEGSTDPSTSYEWKNTISSSSEFEIIPSSTSSHDFRMVRNGSAIELFRREANSNGSWETISTQELNLPGVENDELQVGFNIYTAFEGASPVPLMIRVSDVKIGA